MKHSKINIDLQQHHVMAILNITPDSFYENSRSFTTPEIEDRVKQIVEQGASIIDIGGYSSRPGASEVSIDEEWARVQRGLAAVRKIAPNIAVSLDTFRSEVAELAISEFGSLIINDISAGEMDPKLISVAAKYDAPYIAMHMRGTPQTMQQSANRSYNNITDDVIEYFQAKISQLKSAGVNNIIIDPGFGFAKDLEQNYSLMANLNRFKCLDVPILVGISRKSMIYKLLETSPKESLTGTIALNWEAIRQGASIIRVHDVREAVETVKIFQKMTQQ